MKNKQPPFQITNMMIDYVAEIAELVGKLSLSSHLSGNPTLRRANRIRTIHGSLAIEQNTLLPVESIIYDNQQEYYEAILHFANFKFFEYSQSKLYQ